MGGPESEVSPFSEPGNDMTTGLNSGITGRLVSGSASIHLTNDGPIDVISCFRTKTSSSQHCLPSILVQWFADALLQHDGRLAGS